MSEMHLDVGQTWHRNLTTGQALLERCQVLAEPLERVTALIGEALLGGRTLLCCGNGGSAADSAHFTAELAGRYKLPRRGFPAIDLTSEHSLLTALINDYPPEEVFARQIEAFGQRGDVLAVFTTSGDSENVRLALERAAARGLRTVAFLGKGGGRCKGLAEVELLVPHDVTARVQEVHQLLYHTICEVLDPVLAANAPATG